MDKTSRRFELPSEKNVTLPITGMTCANCVATVERNLKRVDGVSDAVVNLSSERATIHYDPEVAELANLLKVQPLAFAESVLVAEQPKRLELGFRVLDYPRRAVGDYAAVPPAVVTRIVSLNHLAAVYLEAYPRVLLDVPDLLPVLVCVEQYPVLSVDVVHGDDVGSAIHGGAQPTHLILPQYLL